MKSCCSYEVIISLILPINLHWLLPAEPQLDAHSGRLRTSEESKNGCKRPNLSENNNFLVFIELLSLEVDFSPLNSLFNRAMRLELRRKHIEAR